MSKPASTSPATAAGDGRVQPGLAIGLGLLSIAAGDPLGRGLRLCTTSAALQEDQGEVFGFNCFAPRLVVCFSAQSADRLAVQMTP